MWGTFNGKEGYFWDRFEEAYINKHPKARFKAWKETTEDVLTKKTISKRWTKEQREDALILLEDEKREMSEAHYAQEYMAQPSDDIKRIFSDDWIEKVCTIESEDQEQILKGRDYYMGVDIARGKSETSVAVGVGPGQAVELREMLIKICKMNPDRIMIVEIDSEKSQLKGKVAELQALNHEQNRMIEMMSTMYPDKVRMVTDAIETAEEMVKTKKTDPCEDCTVNSAVCEGCEDKEEYENSK